MKNNYLKNQQGQALLFVVVALTIALAAGIGISFRTISSTSRTTQTDTASRALAAAEAGAERFLVLPIGALAAADKDLGSSVTCPQGLQVAQNVNNDWGCKIEFTPDTGDNITTQTVVVVDDYSVNTNGTHFRTSIPKGQVAEINIRGYTPANIMVCWQGDSHLHYVVYSDSGTTLKGIIRCVAAACTTNPPDFGGTVVTANQPARDGLPNCRNISVNVGAAATRMGLRIRSINGDAIVGVYPTNATFPTQGYSILSTGSLQESSTQITVAKTVRVNRSLPYPSGVMDFAIFSNSGILP